MELLFDITISLALAIPLLFFSHLIKIPAVVSFLATGVLIGPHGLGVIGNIHDVEIMAEIGVILLLFSIGLEFSMKKVVSLSREVLLGGSLQVFLTIAVVAGIAYPLTRTLGASIFVGCLISLSSTAIVLKLLQDRMEIETPHGRTSLAILIYQDIIVVPMMLILPFLGGVSGNTVLPFLLTLGKGVLVVVIILISARWLVPPLLHRVASTRMRELFLLTVLVLCFGEAWATSQAGLSLALGAFLAGVVIAESEYSHQAVANILPFRDIFTSLFFISIGMLLDVSFVIDNIGLVLLVTLAVISGKAVLAGLAVGLLGYPLRAVALSGLALAQVGEFSFVLFEAGKVFRFLPPHMEQLFLSVTVLSMVVAPFCLASAPFALRGLLNLPFPTWLKQGRMGQEEGDGDRLNHLDGHLVIFGFGLTGRNLARAAKDWSIPYVIVEMNPETVRREKALGEPIFFGDASQESILIHARVEWAKVVAVAISDPMSVAGIVQAVRQLNKTAHIIVRTRFTKDRAELLKLGASEVVTEEFESAMEIFSRVLSTYLIPRGEIDRFLEEIRTDGYAMSRSPAPESVGLCEFLLPNFELKRVRVGEGALAAGKTIGEVGLRRRFKVTLLAMRRGGQVISDPGADTTLQVDDILLLVGRAERFPEAEALFHHPQNGGIP